LSIILSGAGAFNFFQDVAGLGGPDEGLTRKIHEDNDAEVLFCYKHVV